MIERWVFPPSLRFSPFRTLTLSTSPCPLVPVFSSAHNALSVGFPATNFSRLSLPCHSYAQAHFLYRHRWMNTVVNARSKAEKWKISSSHPLIHLTRLVFKEGGKKKAIINKGNSWLDSFIDGLRLYRSSWRNMNVSRQQAVRWVVAIWGSSGISVNKGSADSKGMRLSDYRAFRYFRTKCDKAKISRN